MAFGDPLQKRRQNLLPQSPVPMRPIQSQGPQTRTMAPGAPIGTQAMQTPSNQGASALPQVPGMGPSAGPKRRRPGQSPTGIGSAAMGAFQRGAF